MRGAVLLLAVAVVAVAWPVGGQGQPSFGVTPGTVTLPDAQAGQSYLRTVTVQNQLDSASTITVEAQGEFGAWMSTEPPSGFVIPARTNKAVVVTVAVPPTAGPGQHVTIITFTTEPKETIAGSGQMVRPSAGATFNITVGGQAVRHIAWGEARVVDAQEGQPVSAYVRATNNGNVADDAIVSGGIIPFDQASPVLRESVGRKTLRPGESGDVEVTFAAGLAIGQYRVQLRSSQVEPLDVTLDFKVFAAGTQAPSGTFRGINHEPFAFVGQPFRLEPWFHNDGNVPVAAAKFKAEVRQDGRLLSVLESDALAVAPGQHVNLTVYWTPPQAGTYLVNGTVLYDGYLTLPAESIVNVKDTANTGGGFPWLWLGLLLALVVGMILYFVLRRRKDDEPHPARPTRR